MRKPDITLGEALASGRLSDFIDQAERDGVGPAKREAFDALARVAAKEKPAKR